MDNEGLWGSFGLDLDLDLSLCGWRHSGIILVKCLLEYGHCRLLVRIVVVVLLSKMPVECFDHPWFFFRTLGGLLFRRLGW
jgi:hypothetical protein